MCSDSCIQVHHHHVLSLHGTPSTHIITITPPPIHTDKEPSPDMYVIGSQETGSFKEWKEQLQEVLGAGYVRLASHSLMQIGLVVFVRKMLRHRCGHVHKDAVPTGRGDGAGGWGLRRWEWGLGRWETRLLLLCVCSNTYCREWMLCRGVAVGRSTMLILNVMHTCHWARVIPSLPPYVHTGVGNMLGNKGGVAIAFKFDDTRLLFVTAHFAAHEKMLAQRNADFHRINKFLFMPKTSGWCVGWWWALFVQVRVCCNGA